MMRSQIVFVFATQLFLGAASAQNDSCSTKTEYINCFTPGDGGVDFLPVELSSDAANTPIACAARCKEEGYVYTGTKNGTRCFCGTLEPWDSHKESETHCNVACPGDPKETCGGAEAIQVYYVYPDGCDWIKVIESSESPLGRYHASNVLINGCGDRFQDATQKDSIYGRATRNFCVSVSEEGEHWDEVVCGTLNDDHLIDSECSVTQNNTATFSFPPRMVKYGRFVVKSYRNYGAALEYFDLRGPQNCN